MKRDDKRWLAQLRASIISSSIFLIMGYIAFSTPANDSVSSATAFAKASQVFFHPRCVNCHPSGDRPLIGDNSIPHPMDVKRGKYGLGDKGLWCSSCHQDKNTPGLHSPPGGSDWHLPPTHMPMVFEKRSARQLCEQFKDRTQNGNRSPEQIVKHVREAPLVQWAWNPGEGRKPVPMPHSDFIKYMTEWASKGAACPQ